MKPSAQARILTLRIPSITFPRMSNIALSDERNSLAKRKSAVPQRLLDAIELMVEEGLSWQDAAHKADYNIRQMRRALERPHVLQLIKQRREMLRASVSAGNIHRLRSIADAAKNMPAVQAIKLLEEMGEERGLSGSHGIAQSNPGVTIVITHTGQPNGRSPVPSQTIEGEFSTLPAGSSDGERRGEK